MKKNETAALWLAACALVLGIAGCRSETTITTATQTTEAGSQSTAATASVAAPAQAVTTKISSVQRAEDRSGDVQSVGETKSNDQIAPLVDIEVVQLELGSDSLLVSIRAAADLPAALPELVTALAFSLELSMDESTSYVFEIRHLGKGWEANIVDYDGGNYFLPQDTPTVAGNTISCTFALSDMPAFSPSFRWRIMSACVYGIEGFEDYLPDMGADPTEDQWLTFPSS